MNKNDFDNTCADGAEEHVSERFALAAGRTAEIAVKPEVAEQFADYFKVMACFLVHLSDIYRKGAKGELESRSLEECERTDALLYADLLPEAYESSYANPVYAVKVLGEEYGQYLSMLTAHLKKKAPEAFGGEILPLTAAMELFVQIYNSFEAAREDGGPDRKEIEQDIYWYFHDYSEIFYESRLRKLIDPDECFQTDIVMHADLENPAYLYRYGMPVGANERKMAAFLNELAEEEIQAMADTFTEGYRAGFVVTGKDLSKKKTVQIRYPVGFERMVRAIVRNFDKMNLKPTMAASVVPVNRQYDYDHKEDRALFLDKAYVERCLEVERTYLEAEKTMAAGLAGSAVVQVFGEEPFFPEARAEAPGYSEKQRQICVYETSAESRMISHYTKRDERSCTIIAYPIPAIGPQFREIFAETVKVNTLDSGAFVRIQQKMTDVLDQADRVHITGKGDNHTDLLVKIKRPADPLRETAFENCVADVNIPAGEVFTSPVLAGTEGKLHVRQVYLNGLCFRELKITFKDGMITDYSCANFKTEEENRRYIRDHVLMHHDTLPMGEFAIGTNTTAYRMARDYRIADKLPILIAEKTGPHFAVGDTCYSHEEDNLSRNPDGKVLVAKENEVSALRKCDEEKAYYNCHTDITIPYDELDQITVIREDGTSVAIIADGFFVLPGTEELNGPLLA